MQPLRFGSSGLRLAALAVTGCEDVARSALGLKEQDRND